MHHYKLDPNKMRFHPEWVHVIIRVQQWSRNSEHICGSRKQALEINIKSEKLNFDESLPIGQIHQTFVLYAILKSM